MCIKDAVVSPSTADISIVTTMSNTNSITFYTSMVGPACRAVQLLLTHLGIPAREVNKSCYIDTRTEEFRKVKSTQAVDINTLIFELSSLDQSLSYTSGN